MGFKTFTIFCTDRPGYFGTSPTHDPARAAQLLSVLGLQDYELISEEAYLNDYPQKGDLYVGAYEGGVVIAHDTLPALLFDETSRKRNFGRVEDNAAFRQAIHALFPAGEVTALILHSVVNMWGFSVYRKGELLRCASGAEGEFFGSTGAPLPEEEVLLAEHPIETIDSGEIAYSEDLVFDVSSRVFGCRYDEAGVDELKCSQFKRKTPPGKKSLLSRLFG
jgi:hypothetical protein